MNKIQYIKLLNLRGITKLDGMSIASAIRQTGGEPTDKEMVEVNKQAMMYYIDRLEEQTKLNEEMKERIAKLQERDFWLDCLEAAGVDNWEGYDVAIDIRDGN